MIINTDSHDDWEIHDELFEDWNKVFNFTLDFCATFSNTKCKKYYIKQQDALKQYPKGEVIWCNPPYSAKDKPRFIQKCLELSNDNIVVMLIPVATSTKQFHKIIIPYTWIHFLEGRPKFKGINNKGKYVDNQTGTRDCMIIIFR